MHRNADPHNQRELIMPNYAAYIGYRDLFGDTMPIEQIRVTLGQIGLTPLLTILGGINAATISRTQPTPDLERSLANLFMSSNTIGRLHAYGWPLNRNASTIFHRGAVLALAKYALVWCPRTGIQIGPDAGVGELILAISDFLSITHETIPNTAHFLDWASGLLPVVDLSRVPKILAEAGRARAMWSRCSDSPNSDIHRNWAKSFLEAYGVSISDFVRSVYIMLAHYCAFDPADPECGNYLWINPDVFLANSNFSPNAFRSALDILASSQSDLALALSERLDGTWLRDTTILRRWPLIKLDSNTYFCLDIGFLSSVLDEGIYWLTIECLDDKQQRLLRSQFGDEFASYLMKILERIMGPASRQLAVRHGTLKFDGSTECTDAFIDGGDRLALFEFKASLLRPIAKYSGSRFELENDMRAKFAGKGIDKQADRKGVTQLAWSIKKLLDGNRVTEPGFDISRFKQILPVLVCYDAAITCPRIPEYLDDVFQVSLDSMNVNKSRIGRLCVLSTREFEALEPLSRESSVINLLQQYIEQASTLTTFWDFAVQAHPNKIRPDNTLVGEEVQALHAEVYETFFR